MRRDAIWLTVLLVLAASSVRAADERARPVSRAPLAVSGDAVLEKGGVVLSYRYERVSQRGTQDGRDEQSAEEVVRGTSFDTAPDRLDHQAHVFGLLWAPIQDLTLSFEIPFLSRRMESVVLSGASLDGFETHSIGFGDFELSLLYRTWYDEKGSVHVNLGVSLPSGTINAADEIPGSGTSLVRLPYPMQLGTGTVDLLPGMTYNGHLEGWFWGGQVLGRLHAGTNSKGYRRGNRYELQAWAGRDWLPWFGSSFRLHWQHGFNLNGEDTAQAARTDPTMDPNRQAGQRLDALFGVDFFAYGGRFEGVRLAIEGGLPAYQRLEGPQPRTSWILSTGIEYAF